MFRFAHDLTNIKFNLLVNHPHVILRAFATNRKIVKCSPLPEFNMTVQGDWVWWTVLKFDVDPKSMD